jgi:LAO/AO transport system kinase
MTETMVREVRSVLALSQDPDGWKVPILRTEAARGDGVEELAASIDEHRSQIEAAGTLEERRARNLRNEVLGIASSRLRRGLEATAAGDAETQELLDRVVRRELDPASAASELLERQAADG